MNVVFLPAAEHDLDSLSLYIHDELQNPTAAYNIVTKILRRAKSLEAYPEMGAHLGDIDHRLDGYRHVLADNYLVIYRVTDQEAVIVRILYARSDYVQLLQG